MAQHTRQQTPGNPGNPGKQPTQGKPVREGDEPQDLREAKPDHRNPDAKDRGRDRNPGDMQRDENDQNDVKGTGFDESDTKLDDQAGDTELTGEDETNASSGSHSKNPNPRSR